MARASTTTRYRRTSGLLAGLIAALGLSLAAGTAEAQLPSTLILSIAANPSSAPSGGQVTFNVVVKNDGAFRAKPMVVTVTFPPSTQFVRCTARREDADPPAPQVELLCSVANGVATVDFTRLLAHREARVNLTLLMPTVTTPTDIIVDAQADSDTATDDRNQATARVLPPGSFVTFLPSGRAGVVACGTTLDAAAFGSDTTVKLSGNIGCTTEPFGIKLAAPDKTIDLNSFKIIAAPPGGPIAGTAGILLSNAPRAKILGRAKGNLNGIEQFDWCIKDEGSSRDVVIDTVRCFRGRSAGFDVISKGTTITNSLVDRVIGTAVGTALPPGGIGIRMSGDNSTLDKTIVRSSGTVGLWLAGVDKNGDGVVAKVGGSKTTTRLEKNAGIGMFLEGGPHIIDPMYVEGDADNSSVVPTSTDGVVIDATGIDSRLKGVAVKKFVKNAYIVRGSGTQIETADVEEIGVEVEMDRDDVFIPGDGFIVTGPGTVLTSNKVAVARHGFVVSGLDAVLELNEVEEVDGNGYVIEGDNATLTGNTAKNNAFGTGFIISGTGGLLDTNEAENNKGGHGFEVSGQGYTIRANVSQKSGLTEWVIAPGNTDGGANKKDRGVRFTFTSAGGTFE